MTVLVTSADSIKALVVVRSLGSKGIPVITGSHIPTPLAASSKYSVRHITYPSPIYEPIQFKQKIIQFLKDNECDMLFPVHSEDTLCLNEFSDTIRKYTKFPFTEKNKMIAVNDKGILAEIAQNLEIPIPKTWIVEHIEDIMHVGDEISFPAVIKMRNATSSFGQSYVKTKEELILGFSDTIQRFSLSTDEYPIIQEFIAGTGYGVSLLFNHGKMRALFTHKRIREFPVSGGPSTCRISTRHDKMEEYAVRLLTHLSWHGIAMVEFKLTHNGTPFLLEVNPRIWGSINQAIQSGVDFPHLLYRMALDGDVSPVISYREGIVTRNCMLDVISYIQGTIAHNPYQSRKLYLQYPYYDDIFSLDDLLPSISVVKMAIQNIKKISLRI